jgi:hypothetical protein
MTRRPSANTKKDANGFTVATLEERLALRSIYSLDPDELSDLNEVGSKVVLKKKDNNFH